MSLKVEYYLKVFSEGILQEYIYIYIYIFVGILF